MNFFLGLILGLITGGIVVYLIMRNRKVEQTVVVNEDETKKKENFVKIEEFIKDKEKFTNDELQNLLNVSDTTIGRYLDELEKAGKIKQVGKTGVAVFYTRSH